MFENTRSNPEKYSRAYSRLHWAIATCVISLFSMQYIRRLFGEDAHDVVREIHKSIGIVLIVLIAWRLLLRMRTSMPPRFADSSTTRAAIAAWVTTGLWTLMMLVPLLGVTFLLVRGRGINFFFLFRIGPLTTGSAEWGGLALRVHRSAAFCLIALVILHIGGTLFHHFVLRDGVMSRMSVWRRRRPARARTRDEAVDNAR